MSRDRPTACPRSLTAAGLALGLLASSSGARAEFIGERRLRIEMGRGQATVRVHVPGRRIVEPGGFFSQRSLGLVAGGVVSSMRVAHPQGGWLPGALWQAAPAETLFLGQPRVESTGAVTSERTLLAWQSRGSVALSMIVDEQQPHERAVEFSMLAPTSYQAGREEVDLAPMLSDGPLTITVTGGHGEDQLLLDGVGLDPGASRTLRGESATVALVPSEREPLRGSLALTRAGQKTLVHAHIDTPSRLGEAPREARVVIVLDGSRSMKRDDRRAAVNLARAYLARLPDARAAVVVYDRRAHALQTSLVSASEALASLADLPAAGNGSRLDLALERAIHLLEGAPGPRRVLVLTDGLVRSALDGDVLAEVTRRTGALVHLGLVSEANKVSRHRLDQHSWATAARATGGLLWSLSAPASGPLDPLAAEELVRPLAIDQLQARWVGGDRRDDISWNGRLDEGEARDLDEVQSGATGVLEVTGELWATPVRLRLRPSPAGNAAWTRLAVGSSLFDELDEAEKHDLARRARVVSPFHSLLAVSPGLNQGPGASGGRSFGDQSTIHLAPTLRMGSVSTARTGPSDLITALVTTAWMRCTGGRGAADVSLEATLNEVVDVTRVITTGVTAEARGCLETAVWQLDLTGQDRRFVQQTVELGSR